jgi:hypothetical protein
MSDNKEQTTNEHNELAEKICGQCEYNLTCPLAYDKVEECLAWWTSIKAIDNA